VVANGCETPNGCGNGGDGSIGVLIGNGDGTFQSGVAYDSGGIFASSVAVADVNGDGKPDVVVANCLFSCSYPLVGVLLGNGDGTFQAAMTYGSGGAGYSLAVADVNGDGKPDIVVPLDSSDGSVGVLLGNGDGTFQTTMSYGSGGYYATGVAVADVNGDGKPDLLVTNNYSSTVGVLINTSRVATILGFAAS
jgi:FG-GAP-like repeat